MNLYFMRHGQTDYNVRGLCNDDPGRAVRLTELGRQQARAAAGRLGDVPIERIFVSELPRTHETAAIVNAAHGVPVEVEPGLNDWRTGLDGQPVTDLYAAIRDNPMDTRVGDGETLREHQARVHACIDRLRGRPLGTVLVIAHEESLRAASSYFHGLSDDEMLALHFDNTALLSFEA